MPFAIGGHRGYALFGSQARTLLVADGTLSRVAAGAISALFCCPLDLEHACSVACRLNR